MSKINTPQRAGLVQTHTSVKSTKKSKPASSASSVSCDTMKPAAVFLTMVVASISTLLLLVMAVSLLTFGKAYAAKYSESEMGESPAIELVEEAEEEAEPELTEEEILAMQQAAIENERNARINALLEEAASHLGVPYVYGGSSPSGFDCSGFTSWSMRQALDIELPRTAAGQSTLGESVPMDALQPGDFLFWGGGWGVYHVGIYYGDGTYIHSPSYGRTVSIDPMTYDPPTFAKRIL